MWVLNNYVISPGIYLVLRVVSGGNVSLTGPCGHGQDGGDEPLLRATIWKGQGLFRSSVETTPASPKASPFLIPSFETCKSLISPRRRE